MGRSSQVSNDVGFLELIVGSDTEPAMSAFRDAVIREVKKLVGVRAIAQASVCMVGNVSLTHESCLQLGENIMFLEASKKAQTTNKFVDVLFGQRSFRGVHCGNTCWLCGIQNCQRRFVKTLHQHPWNTQKIVAG